MTTFLNPNQLTVWNCLFKLDRIVCPQDIIGFSLQNQSGMVHLSNAIAQISIPSTLGKGRDRGFPSRHLLMQQRATQRIK
jgi:hypothetical protein